jgi:hypothetical protein
MGIALEQRWELLRRRAPGLHQLLLLLRLLRAILLQRLPLLLLPILLLPLPLLLLLRTGDFIITEDTQDRLAYTTAARVARRSGEVSVPVPGRPINRLREVNDVVVLGRSRPQEHSCSFGDHID